MRREDLIHVCGCSKCMEKVICLHDDGKKIKEGRRSELVVREMISMLFKYCMSAILNVSQEDILGEMKTDQFKKKFLIISDNFVYRIKSKCNLVISANTVNVDFCVFIELLVCNSRSKRVDMPSSYTFSTLRLLALISGSPV